MELEEEIREELTSKIEKQHIVACWVAIVVNFLWTLLNYSVFFENNLVYLFIGASISFITYIGIRLRKAKVISPELLGMIPMTLMGIYFAYTYSRLDLRSFQEFTLIYVAMFLGAGMFLQWRIKFSFITVVGSIIANIVFFYWYSPLTFVEIMLNGGIVVVSIFFFMTISIQIRYNYVLNTLLSNKALLKSQEKIKKSEIQNRLLFNQNPSPMIIYDLETLDILDVNETMIKKYGYTKNEFLNMKITQLRDKKDINKLIQDVENVKNGIEKVSEWTHLLKNGEKIIVEVLAKSIDYQKKNARLVSIIDITKRKKIHKKLVESEEEHRLYFKNNPIPMFVFSEQKKQILAINNAMENKYGYSIQGFSNLSLVNEPLYDKFCELFTPKHSEESEYTHVVKSGDIIIVKARIIEINHKNELAKLVSLHDITDIKHHEMALEDARIIAEEAKERQSQFLSNMSHEIRTPMNGILGMTRLLKETKLSKEQSKYTKAIYTSADNLMVIINEILDFSKIEAGKLKIEKVPFNLKELATIWKETLFFTAEEKNIGFGINIDETVPTWIIGDPVRLNQIIYNLAGNALKFTNKGAVNIDIHVKRSTNDRIKLQFDVIDTGIGIPEEKQDSIFFSFSQASSSTTRKYGGTGLGLTITKQLVELQDGVIWIESEEGKGSTFSFILDYKIKKQKVKESTTIKKVEAQDHHHIKPLNVLLVEDHDINQVLATTVLEGWDFSVDLAKNGEEAVNKVASENYDVILMDIHMPIMDGYEATRQIRNKLNNQTPVIAMTASARIGENQKCFDVGMNDYITKPFDPDLLYQKITLQVNKKRA